MSRRWTKFRQTKPRRWSAALAGLSLFLGVFAWAGPIVDRVVANVNGQVVLQSDWEEEIAFEAFEDGRDPNSLTEAEQKAALDRLIDQELLREQVRPGQSAPASQVAERMAEVRKLHPNSISDEGWHAALERYGLTQRSLEKRLGDEIQLMKLVEDRLRPSIHIDQKAVEAYYHDQLLPELKRAGAPAKPLAEVYGKIKDVLAEQKLNELLSGWLASLRSESHIQTPAARSGEQNR